MNYIKTHKNIIFTAVVLILCFFSVSNAEMLASEDDIYIEISPTFPRANQDVSIGIKSYITDLDRAEILWYKNNILKQKGLGQKNFSFRTSGLGDYDIITIQINTDNLGQITKNITIRPAEVNLVWETDSYVPPFYKGKALNSYQADIKIIAIPNFMSLNGNVIKPKDLIYTWKKGWKILGNDSGLGKNTLTISGKKMLRGDTIIVEVETVDNKLKAAGIINISFNNPKIIFYEENPVLGVVYEKALSNFNLTGEEITIKAKPFFFSNEDIKRGNIKYSWVMNNKKITSSNSDMIVLRQDGENMGITNLQLKIQNLSRIMQFASNGFNINFGGIKNTPVFGVAQ